MRNTIYAEKPQISTNFGSSDATGPSDFIYGGVNATAFNLNLFNKVIDVRGKKERFVWKRIDGDLRFNPTNRDRRRCDMQWNFQ